MASNDELERRVKALEEKVARLERVIGDPTRMGSREPYVVVPTTSKPYVIPPGYPVPRPMMVTPDPAMGTSKDRRLLDRSAYPAHTWDASGFGGAVDPLLFVTDV